MRRENRSWIRSGSGKRSLRDVVWMVGGAIVGLAISFLVFRTIVWTWAAFTLASFTIVLVAQYLLQRRRGE